MTENIELKSLRVTATAENINDEYNEIKQVESASEQLLSHKPAKVPNEVDFFKQFNVKPPRKHTNKKKKERFDGQSNLIDVIQSEIAAREVPIERNAITLAAFSTEQQNSYLEKPPKLLEMFENRRRWDTDAERGWGQQPICKLSPILPRVLENAIPDPAEEPHIEYVPPNMLDDLLDSNNQSLTKFLDIELQNLKFKHHHYFSLEKLLAEKLVLVYEEYIDAQSKLSALSKEIQINRETKINLQRELLRISPKKEDIRFDASIRKFTGKMIELKFQHMDVLKKEKGLLNKIVSIWSDIEMVREKTGAIRTPYELYLSKTTMDDDEFDIKWTEMYNKEFSDLLDSVEYEFVNKYMAYKEQKHEEGTVKLIKPKINIDEESLKEQAENNANEMLRREKIDTKLIKKDNIITGVKGLPKLAYCFKIYMDDAMVCESDPISEGEDFEFEFFESFSVQILPENIAITIVLFENEEEVSSAKLYISEIKKNILGAEFDDVKFPYVGTIIAPDEKFVGSGYSIKDIAVSSKVRLKSANLFKGHLSTNCKVRIKVGWNKNATQDNEDIKFYLETEKKLKRLLSGVEKCRTDDLRNVIEIIYDKDIGNNTEMMDSLTRICKSNVNIDENTFEIDENSADFTRIKLLQLRNQGELTDVENKRIPLYASQISTEQLNYLQQHKEREFDLNNFNHMDPIEMQRFIGMKYIENLNRNLIKNLNETLLKKTHKDIVCDFQDLSLRNLFTNLKLTDLANIKSCPRRLTLQEVTSSSQEIHVTVMRAFNLPDRTPSALTEESDANDGSIAGFKVRSLRPFVKVQYQGSTAQTATMIGCHPTWSQTLKLNTKPGQLSSIHISVYDEYKANISESYSEASQDRSVHYRCHNRWLGTLEVPLYSVLALGKIRGTFKIHTPPLLLGYEAHAAEKETNRSLIPEITQLLKKETSFLTLQITSTHLGSVQNYGLPIPASSDDDYVISHLNNFLTEYQTDFPTRVFVLTLVDSNGKNRCITQFLQPVPLPDYESFPKDPKRTESAVSKSSNLSKSSSSKSTEYKRNLENVQDVEKESLYSAYESRSWKKGENPIERMMNIALRYVSLIPCYEITESHVVTLMGVELLRVLNGSPFDHTVLLASYFLHLGLRAWVVVGFGLPRGRSSFVLTKYDLKADRTVLLNEQVKGGFLGKSDGFEWHVYDGTTGERFDLRDVGCPLKKVCYVFDCDNIWVNVQSSQECENVSFNFTRPSEWRPVFDKNFFVMKYPIVTDSELYCTAADVIQLRNNLENRIKLKIQKWRPHMKTIWNRYCSTLLRESLPAWEYWAWRQAQRPSLGQRMKQLMLTYKVHGFPLNMPFVSQRSVLSTLKATGAHINDDPNIEFALAVEVYAYPNNVLSVWLYLATVARLA